MIMITMCNVYTVQYIDYRALTLSLMSQRKLNLIQLGRSAVAVRTYIGTHFVL